MALKQFDQTNVVADQFDYADHTVYAIDFGPNRDPTVDLVDDTAIVIVNDNQHEIDLPTGNGEVINNNGIVTITVRK